MRAAKDAEGQFCRQITGRNENNETQGPAYDAIETHLATASGKHLGLIGVHGNFDRKRFEVLLAKWNELPEAERKPGAVQVEPEGPRDPAWAGEDPPAGHLALKVFVKNLKPDANGELSRDKYIFPTTRAERTDAYRDSLWLTEAEWKSLVPKEPRKGDILPVPATMRERIFRFGLMERYRAMNYPWSREEIRSGDVTVTVEETTGPQLRLRLDGQAVIASELDIEKADKGYKGTLLGYLDYDLQKKTFTRFDLLALGENWWNKHDKRFTLLGTQKSPYIFEEEYYQLLGQRLLVGVAFELAPPDSGFARIVPGGTSHWPAWPCDYWGTKSR